MAVVTIIVEELCQSRKSENSEDSRGSGKQADEEPSVPMFGEAVSSFEAHVYYFCSCKFDEASLSTVEHQEGTALHHT